MHRDLRVQRVRQEAALRVIQCEAGFIAGGFDAEDYHPAIVKQAPAASEIVAPLRVLECPLQIEVRLLHAHRPAGWPEHEEAASFVILETAAVRVHAHEDIVMPGTNHVDTAAWQPLFYVFRHYFGTGGRLGANCRAEA
jgi:flavin reductase (DIM6/NTAB) family NADH-FMN oxidoreductase RutF